MSRFVYDKDEKICMGKHQCDFCKNKLNDDYACAKLKQAPKDVLENKVKCKEFERQGIKYPWKNESK